MDIHTDLTCIFTGLYLRLVMGNKKVLIYTLVPKKRKKRKEGKKKKEKSMVNSFVAVTKSNLLVWNKHPGGSSSIP